MDDYWDSFDCQVQCEEAYAQEPDTGEWEDDETGTPDTRSHC